MNALLGNIPFVIVAVGALVGVASSLVGTFLVLRRSSLLSDAISHAILFGIMVVWLVTRQQSGPLLIAGAALTGVATVFLSETLARGGRVRYDAAIGLVFSTLFAGGVLLTNVFARDVHIDQHTVLLGEIGFAWLDVVPVLGLDVPRALLTMGTLTVLNLTFVVVFYKELKLSTFDPGLAVALGFSPGLLFYGLLTLTSATAVAAFDAVGAILLIAFVIVPPSAAYLLTDRLWRMLAYGAGIAMASSVGGYALAVALDVSIGGMMASMTGVFFLVALVASPRYGLLAQGARRTSQRSRFETLALVVHLFHHEIDDPRHENVLNAVVEHLSWSRPKVERILVRSLDEHLVERRGDLLVLTPKGRAAAREIVEPWSRPGDSVAAGVP